MIDQAIELFNQLLSQNFIPSKESYGSNPLLSIVYSIGYVLSSWAFLRIGFGLYIHQRKYEYNPLFEPLKPFAKLFSLIMVLLGVLMLVKLSNMWFAMYGLEAIIVLIVGITAFMTERYMFNYKNMLTIIVGKKNGV